jgi:inhibitor of KinA
MIAGQQCLITTVVMPTGWSIIGRSGIQIMQDDPDNPFLFNVGDSVVFERITRAELPIEMQSP